MRRFLRNRHSPAGAMTACASISPPTMTAAAPQVIIAGIEAHVCVAQTAIDMAQAGFGVFVVADAVSSRAEASVALALTRMGQSGIQVINTEMAVFELLGKAGTPEFKALSGLIK